MPNFHCYIVKVKRKPYARAEPTVDQILRSLSPNGRLGNHNVHGHPVRGIEAITIGFFIQTLCASANELRRQLEPHLEVPVAIDSINKLDKSGVFEFEYDEDWTQIALYVTAIQNGGDTVAGF